MHKIVQTNSVSIVNCSFEFAKLGNKLLGSPILSRFGKRVIQWLDSRDARDGGGDGRRAISYGSATSAWTDSSAETRSSAFTPVATIVELSRDTAAADSCRQILFPALFCRQNPLAKAQVIDDAARRPRAQCLTVSFIGAVDDSYEAAYLIERLIVIA